MSILGSVKCMSLEYTIVCDGCGRLIDASGRSAAAARESVREMGGLVNLPGGKDLCNQCAEKIPRERRQGGAGGGEFGNHQRWHANRNERNPACRYCAVAS